MDLHLSAKRERDGACMAKKKKFVGEKSHDWRGSLELVQPEQ